MAAATVHAWTWDQPWMHVPADDMLRLFLLAAPIHQSVEFSGPLVKQSTFGVKLLVAKARDQIIARITKELLK